MDKFLVVDFETTGNKPKDGDKIIQIGAVLVQNKEIVSRLSTLVNPGISIPPFIQQLTRITDDMVREAPLIEEVLPSFLSLLDGAVFVAHNAYFDLGFLQHTLADCGYLPFRGPVIDTVELSRLLLPNQAGYRLSELSLELDVEHEHPHQADADSLATARIFIALLEKLDALPYITVQRLANLAKGFSSDIGQLIQAVERKRLIEGKTDQDDPELEIHRQLALRRRLPLSRERQSKLTERPFPDFLEETHRLLAEQMPGFEWRSAQREMMEQIYQAFSQSRHLLVEAGTGTGKSLAYLIPSLYWALESGEKIVISTHTIQLQEQLFTRDLPVLERLFDSQATVALLKGRSNYLCLRKFEQSINEQSENYDWQLSKGQVITWLTETQTGDVEEINLPSGGAVYWKQVQSDAHSCLNNQCPWFSRCFYYSARRRAQDADVIITNHSLVFTDLISEQRVLPAYEYAVIDEAHHFEEVASHHLGLSLNSLQVEGLQGDLVSEKGTGILERLERELSSLPENLQAIQQELAHCGLMALEGREYVRDLFVRLFNWGSQGAKEGMEAGRLVRRYHIAFWLKKDPAGIVQSASILTEWLTDLAHSLEKVYVGIQALKEASMPLRSLVTDLNGVIKECSKLRQHVRKLLLEPNDEQVFWLELDTRSNRRIVHLQMVPTDVAPLLQEQFFANKESIVLTSATLSVNQSFGYSLQQLGLSSGEVWTAQYASPFDYASQTLLCVPQDIPPLSYGKEDVFIQQLSDALAQLGQVTKGRMLVLFTSHHMLRLVHQRLKERMSPQGFTILGHGIDSHSRSKLTKQFKQLPLSILMGTSSFWEGVDIPGDALSCLVIVRLPFLPPNHPVAEARGEYIKSRKGNPFLELSVPQAVIRFKQGFGRLVRTRQDKGVVVVFDKRIVASNYGKYFLRSLPDIPLHYRPLPELLDLIEKWLG